MEWIDKEKYTLKLSALKTPLSRLSKKTLALAIYRYSCRYHTEGLFDSRALTEVRIPIDKKSATQNELQCQDLPHEYPAAYRYFYVGKEDL